MTGGSGDVPAGNHHRLGRRRATHWPFGASAGFGASAAGAGAGVAGLDSAASRRLRGRSRSGCRTVSSPRREPEPERVWFPRPVWRVPPWALRESSELREPWGSRRRASSRRRRGHPGWPEWRGRRSGAGLDGDVLDAGDVGKLRGQSGQFRLLRFDALEDVVRGGGAELAGLDHGEADRGDEKEDAEPGRELLEDVGGVGAEGGIEGTAAEGRTEASCLGRWISTTSTMRMLTAMMITVNKMERIAMGRRICDTGQGL